MVTLYVQDKKNRVKPSFDSCFLLVSNWSLTSREEGLTTKELPWRLRSMRVCSRLVMLPVSRVAHKLHPP